ncbi:DUF2867 domain-containing protein [Thalassotalea aquiviva]|uniref:DUF2867 domain-containing protein n=1 Tax=Thalassotalea aquiviva TaxID=3242415 RepID=UPI00352BAD43
MPTKTKVLVFGASGYIGTHLVPELKQHGYDVRASARQKRVLLARGWEDIETVSADALKPETLGQALANIDIAFYLVHSMAAGKDFAKLDNQAAHNFVKAAEQAGVKRIIYLGSLLPPNAQSEHFLSRKQTGEILASTSVPVTEVRAGIIVGPGSAAFEVMRDIVNHLPILLTPKWVLSKAKPIALTNLLSYFIKLIELPIQGNKIYEVGGPDVLTYEQMMKEYAKYTKHKFNLIKVPLLTPKMVSYWLRAVTSVPANIAKALIEGLKQDVIPNDEEIKSLIPLKLITFEQAVYECLEVEQQNTKVAHWVTGSISCRDYDPKFSFYAKNTGDSARSSASVEAIFEQVTAFGGSKGFYYADFLWYLRRVLDWFFGGPSFRRERRHPVNVRVGDVVDSWRVIALQPPNVMTLKMEMKGPGSGVLEFIIRDKGDHRLILANAYWHPAGPLGLIYWYVCLPAHVFLFKGLTEQIAKRAELAEKNAPPDKA